MKIRTLVRLALQAIRKNKMRATLTMLGIIIGVAAVIVMVAIGSGARAPSPPRSTTWART
jgi:putative ABC transport system permease protein